MIHPETIADMPVSDQGVTRDRYMLIPRVLIFLRRGDLVLLIKGAAYKKLWADKYNGIGGHIERGEDALSAARRELKEEAGLTADLWLCGTVLVDAEEFTGIGLFVFSGQPLHGELKASTEGSLEWVRSSELPGMPVVEDLPDLLGRVLEMKRGDPPFCARSYYDEGERLVMRFTE